MSGKRDIQLFLLALPLLGRNWYRSFRNDHERAYQSLFGYYADFQVLSQEDRQFLRERIIARVESNTQEQAYFSSLRSLILANLWAVPYFVKNIRTFPGEILILWGEKDQALLPHTAERLRAIRPDARYRIIPGAGHLPHQEKPLETAELILEFLH
jgi:pimeloyl-ACP methyl ester carboxylesterase